MLTLLYYLLYLLINLNPFIIFDQHNFIKNYYFMILKLHLNQMINLYFNQY